MKKTINLLFLFLTIGFVKAEVIKNDTVTTKTGLRYVITKKNPKGIAPAAGDQIEAHYTGTLTNGKKFDSSKDRNQTFSFENPVRLMQYQMLVKYVVEHQRSLQPMSRKYFRGQS